MSLRLDKEKRDPRDGQGLLHFVDRPRMLFVQPHSICRPALFLRMPPKRIASTTGALKRKADSADESQSKKAKVINPSTAGPTQHTNKVLPVSIQFPPRTTGTLRLSTWNIAGLAAASKKGFKFYVEAEDADVLVLTETKVRANLHSRFQA